MYSNNLLKMGFTNLEDVETRVIDVNERMARRMEELAAKQEWQEALESSEDGFMSGLSAERMEGVFDEWDPDSEDAPHSNVIKANPAPSAKTGAASAEAESLLEDARKASEEILEQAREQAQAEAEEILAVARADAETEREEVFAAAREKGYQDGLDQAESKIAAKERELLEQRRAMEAEYDAMLDSLEPRFVDAITEVYEHLIGVELSSYRDILVHLVGNAIRKIEGRDFLVRVSGEDYPYVTMKRQELTAALSSPGATLELVEDSTLKHNECMIETEGGIFDCSLGAQLGELRQKLRLLSFEKASS